MVVTGHILAAALDYLEISSLDDDPPDHVIPSAETLWTRTNEERKEVLTAVSRRIVEKYINVSFNEQHGDSESSGHHGGRSHHGNNNCDEVNNYSRYLLSIGCFMLEFKDAIKEGDGNRILRCWHYLLPIFHNSGRTNYCNEAFIMLCQYHYDLPALQAAQLIWSCCINTHGVRGRNIPFDLHLEHLNRLCKESIKGLQANKTKEAIVHCGKVLGTLDPLLAQFDRDNSVSQPSGAHHSPLFKKDLDVIVKELQEYEVFTRIPGRKHHSFPKPRDILHAKPCKPISVWVREHLVQRYFA